MECHYVNDFFIQRSLRINYFRGKFADAYFYKYNYNHRGHSHYPDKLS